MSGRTAAPTSSSSCCPTNASSTASTAQPCIVEGDASQRVVEHEQEKDCDLVVLGKHGQSATEDLLLGSVSKHVLAEGSADVLISTGTSPAATPSAARSAQ